jgi:hypothetical protein
VVPAAVRKLSNFSSSLILLDLKNQSDFYKSSKIKEELKLDNFAQVKRAL